MRALYSGISGLEGMQTEMDVIGNNIANSNTVGFKASRVTFSTALSQLLSAARAPQGNLGGVNPTQVGLGTQIASIDQLMTQGSFQNTGKSTDLAIQGDGFFIVNNGNGNYYTRAGNFSLDQNGTLVQAGTGYKVLGWESAVSPTGQRYVDTNAPIAPIQISANTTMNAKATSQMIVGGNIDSSSGIQPTTITVTDASGKQYTVQFTFSPQTNNFNPFSTSRVYNWTATIVNGPAGSVGTKISGNITLDQYGNVVNDSAKNIYINNSNGTYSLSTTSASTASGAAITLPTSGPISFAESDNTANTVTAGYTNPVYTTSTQIYDSLGNPYTIYIDFTNLGTVSGSGTSTTWGTGTNTAWAWDARLANGTPVNLVTSSGSATSSNFGILEFNSSGRMVGNFALNNGQLTNANAPTGISFTPSDGAATVKSQIDFTSVTDMAGSSSAAITQQNGNAQGTLQSFAINQNGQIIGTFSNGLTDTLGQVALANFNNPSGLNAVGNSLYSESANSGVPQVGTAGTGGRGTFIPGALEMSNVDLAQEFTNMIIAERSFDANARVITTADAMLSQLDNLKQTP
ncbi:MAG: flagellar hook-basal body protein [Mesoaciditoga sp.]|uniref:flagellar hook protein FlgE n=1 Tax=Athalassotoga sp. TaxID=2022597 RepID=UPI000CC7DD75|nr:MAG: flagellar hook-basal body protein [Mesoaciditoga sp.]PMP80432.1 MAG: flagellar hook-basal body protein [Mesoaciditoga sp.]HEU24706.1 flagellar hook-basal body complex protein [Mesoaciditoga lauensis]